MDKAAPQNSTSETAETYHSSAVAGRFLPIFLGILILLILGIAGWYFYAGQKVAPKGPEVAATVNGENILKSTYQSIYDAQKYYWETVYPALTKQETPKDTVKTIPNYVLDNLIQEVLLRQYLTKKNVTVTDDQVKEEIKKQIVDTQWKGDWSAYEADLQKTYHTSLENIMHAFRQRLLVDKVVELEKLDGFTFASWYEKLKNQATIKINLTEYKVASTSASLKKE